MQTHLRLISLYRHHTLQHYSRRGIFKQISVMSAKKSNSSRSSKYQNQSLLTLSSSVQGEQTKKSIETDEIGSYHAYTTSNNSKYFFQLPLACQISSIVSLLVEKFAVDVIHAQEDESGGHILLRGLFKSGYKRAIGRVLDALLFCCRSRGFKRGTVAQTYNFISITIKRETIQSRCLIIITNPYHNSSLHQVFMRCIIDQIQAQLKKTNYSDLQLKQNNYHWLHPYSSVSSPLQLQIHIKKKVFNLLLEKKKSSELSYNSQFEQSLQTIRDQIQKYHKLATEEKPANKKSKSGNPNVVVQIIIRETDSLLSHLHNKYEEDDRSVASYLHSLFSTEAEREITTYVIESALCLHQLNHLKQIYLHNAKEQCQAFNNHCQSINSSVTNEQYFNHLQLKQKYRLPSEKEPYIASILKLREIQYCASMREMLLVIQKTFSSIKLDCLMAHHGKVELSSMDEVWPVLIFITARAGVHNFPVYIQLLNDYVRLKDVFQFEQTIIMSFDIAVQDVAKKGFIHIE